MNTGFSKRVGMGLMLIGAAVNAAAAGALPEAASEAVRKWAVVFDFDTDSCYPSPAVTSGGQVSQGLGVTGMDTSFVAGCRNSSQLSNSNTYHRAASISKNGKLYVVRMYALYFLKDKDLPLGQIEGLGGHRHDWEFALVWATNGVMTHASFSSHGHVTTKKASELNFDAAYPGSVKIVYHKDGGSTHAMRFAAANEAAENDLHRWVTPAIVDWRSMQAAGVSNKVLRALLNSHDFGHANCSVNDSNFPIEISKSPPGGYPGGEEWKVAAKRIPIELIQDWQGSAGN
jgi:Necrosis inducing protein (NPP1)